ncbi:hypothetical protein EJ02DRAFT_458804 [Clathrospora elynae]|uniref:Uncharacterized protein n=1 Tax=Clathrospora elynae TaxID=706981 RepID=A0A6A5SCF6_9PLEO|nr:hypothetical protein EJ02DRAFT_458804 [Clathrospora elynae]
MASPGEIEQLLAHLRHLNAQSRIKHARVEELKRQLQQAQNEEANINASYRKYLIYRARADCLQLATMMHEKLPAELRKLVYEYLCVEPDQPILVGPYYHTRKYDLPFRNPPMDTQPSYGRRIRYHHVTHRRSDPKSYAGHVAGDTADDVDMGEASETEDIDTGSTRFGDPQSIDDSDFSVRHDLAESIKRLNVRDDVEDINLDDGAIVLPDGRVKEDHSHRPPSDMVVPSTHFLNPRYVGSAVSLEIQKMYYTRNTFSVCNVEHSIHNFLFRHSGYSMKQWRSGRAPLIPQDLRLTPLLFPCEHVRNLQVRVKFEQFHSNMPANATSVEAYAYEQNFLRFTRSNLEKLGDLQSRSKRGLNIEFIVMTELPILDEDENVLNIHCNFVNFLQAIRNIVYTLMHDRSDTTVKITHHDDGFSTFPRDITGLFALTKEQWEYEKEIHGARRRRWVSEFYLAPARTSPLTCGFDGLELDDLLRERWGIDSINEAKAMHPIKEGRYWPKGNASDYYLDG